MGTSSSFRAPELPRWSAFVAALVSQASIERVRSELFNAGSDWQAELAAPAVATFAEAVATAGAASSATELVAKYAGEVLGQYARHVTDREAGRLVGERLGAAASARLSTNLAERAASIGTTAASDLLRQTSDIPTAWADVVARAFEAGRKLPRDNS